MAEEHGGHEPVGGADRMLADLLALIDRYGWAVRHVGGDSALGFAAFSYTIGLTALNHPELVITGMPFDSAQGFLNLAGETVRSGGHFAAGSRDRRLSDTGAVVFIRAVDTSDLVAVDQVYGQVTALQLIWPDSAGSFPWQPAFRNPPGTQPLLGPLPDHWVDVADE